MRNYEVTFIVDPVLSRDEIEATAKGYVDYVKDKEGNIVHVDEMGLRELAYPINKRNSGYYYSVEFEAENGEMIPTMELNMRRDLRIMRFLTVKLDKYGVKFNADRRAGLIGKSRAKKEEEKAEPKAEEKAKPKAEPKPAPAKTTKPEKASKKEEEE